MQNIFPVDVVFTILGDEALKIQSVNKKSRTNIKVNGFDVYQQSLRYATFYQKGTKCACCGKEGIYFKLEADKDGLSAETRRHFNLYAEDGTLMTKDHIRPKKLGGLDVVDNLQTMCVECNKAKGSIYNKPIETIVAQNTENPDNKHYFINLDDAVVYLCDKRHILSSKSKPGKLARKVVAITRDLIHALTVNEPYAGYHWFVEDKVWEGVPHI